MRDEAPARGDRGDRGDALRYGRLFLLSFLTLFLELMLIRWVPGVVRFVAYYTNLLLISSFLGLGLGALMAQRRRELLDWFPVLLALDVLVLLAAHTSTLPGTAREFRFFGEAAEAARVSGAVALIAIFLANTAVFVPLGQQIGRLFASLPTLKAYAWDLGGSLCGTATFGCFSYFHFSPLLGAGAVSALFLLTLHGGRRVAVALVPLALALALMVRATDPDARWSPYYHITVANIFTNVDDPPPVATLRSMRNPPIFGVRVNQDFYQFDGSYDPARYDRGTGRYEYVRAWGVFYGIPYQVHPQPKDVLVVGVGGGPDVEAAVLAGARHVDAVDIDPVLIQLSRRYNASGVYDDPRVSVHIDDARAFFRRTDRSYDVVAFAFLDSQGLSTAMSNIRLDSYVYTVESMRAAWGLVREGGALTLAFASGTTWMVMKLRNMLQEATGRSVITYFDGTRVAMAVVRAPRVTVPSIIGQMPAVQVGPYDIQPPTDDWPYLYLNHPTIPGDYLLVIGTLLLLSALALAALLPRRAVRRGGFEFLFLGTGFLLLQTRSVVDCALYFGATWLVTTIVVAGVLLMVFAANLTAMRLARYRSGLFLPLLASLALLYLVPRDLVLAAPPLARFAWALLVVPLPIFFAGLIFSTRFRGAPDTAWALGINLVGAVLGGFLEYLGMAVGGRALLLVAALAYLAANLAARTTDRLTSAAAAQASPGEVATETLVPAD